MKRSTKRGNHSPGEKDQQFHLVAVAKAPSPAQLLATAPPKHYMVPGTLLLAPLLHFLEDPWHGRGQGQRVLSQTAPGRGLGLTTSQGLFSIGILHRAVQWWSSRQLSGMDAGSFVPVDLSAREWSRMRLI